MTEAQAQKLGQMINAARQKKGLSLRDVANQVDISHIWLKELESGHYTDPAPDRLARLAELLDIDPVRIDRVNKDVLANSLPDVRTYFRAKDKLSPEQLDEVEATMKRLRSKYAKAAARSKTIK